MKKYYLFVIVLLVTSHAQSNGFSKLEDVRHHSKATSTPPNEITGVFTICLPGPNTTQLSASGIPDPTTPWVSSNPAVATINNIGLVTAINYGSTTITYYDNIGNISSANVYVSAYPTVTGNFNTYVGSTNQLTGSLFPNTITPWTSLDTAIATVSNTGIVTGVSVGVCNIVYMNLAGCTVAVPITINTACPQAGNSGSLAVCDSNTTVINLFDIITNEDAGGIWTRASGFGGTFNSMAGTFTTGIDATTSTFIYTVTGTTTCQDVASDATIIISPFHTAGILTGVQNICVGFTTTLTSTVIGGTWTTSNPTIATVNATTGLVTGISAGVATITYTVNGVAPCGNETATRTVTVNPSVSTNLFCDPTNVTSSISVAFDWSNVPTATNYEYSYSINNNPFINGTTSVSHYEIFGVLPGQNVIFTLTNAVGVSCFQPISTTCTNLANIAFETDTFLSFPNPVSNVLNLTNTNSINNVIIVNSVGQQVLNQSYDSKSIQIDMSGLMSGIYMVKLSTDNSTKTIKIIKD